MNDCLVAYRVPYSSAASLGMAGEESEGVRVAASLLFQHRRPKDSAGSGVESEDPTKFEVGV